LFDRERVARKSGERVSFKWVGVMQELLENHLAEKTKFLFQVWLGLETRRNKLTFAKQPLLT
jgi:hypothetical protein